LGRCGKGENMNYFLIGAIFFLVLVFIAWFLGGVISIVIMLIDGIGKEGKYDWGWVLSGIFINERLSTILMGMIGIGIIVLCCVLGNAASIFLNIKL
jgi:hypothetical protein